nr:MAG TPA: hypothetical protein [Caudoviricetes sp.]
MKMQLKNIMMILKKEKKFCKRFEKIIMIN